MKAIFLGVVLFIVGSIVWGILNLGVFKSATFEFSTENQTMQYELLAISKNGAYHEINDTLVALEKWAEEKKISCNETFGLFYDNPDVVESARLRADVGCVLPAESLESLKQINLAEEKILKKDSLKHLTLTASKILLASFAGSPWLGPYKVYGEAHNKLSQAGTSSQFPVLEIYKTKAAVPHTEYVFFISPPEIMERLSESRSTPQ